MNIAGLISAMPVPVRCGILAVVNRNDGLRYALSKLIINRYAYSARCGRAPTAWRAIFPPGEG